MLSIGAFIGSPRIPKEVITEVRWLDNYRVLAQPAIIEDLQVGGEDGPLDTFL
jgi:hypothetical protein